jgi:hypothetical protein
MNGALAHGETLSSTLRGAFCLSEFFTVLMETSGASIGLISPAAGRVLIHKWNHGVGIFGRWFEFLGPFVAFQITHNKLLTQKI